MQFNELEGANNLISEIEKMYPYWQKYRDLAEAIQVRNETNRNIIINLRKRIDKLMAKHYPRPGRENKMPEQIKYPTEHKTQTLNRVTYNAEVTKLYDRREFARIEVKDLTFDKLRRLLLDITGLDAAS